MKRVSNIFTTIIGLIIFGASGTLVFIGKATMTEASGFMVIAAGLLFSKDKEFLNNFLPFINKASNQDQGGSSSGNQQGPSGTNQ